MTASEALKLISSYLDNGYMSPVDARAQCRRIVGKVEEAEEDVGIRVEKSKFGYNVRVDGRSLGLDVSYDTAQILIRIIASGREGCLVYAETVPMGPDDSNYKFKFEVGLELEHQQLLPKGEG